MSEEHNLLTKTRFLELAYSELRRIAERLFAGERGNHTLQPTALVHEMFIKLQQMESFDWANPQQFFAFASGLMRRVLVDHARGKNAEKRGGQVFFVALTDLADPGDAEVAEILALEQALDALETRDKRKAQLVELKYFGGLNNTEIAEHLGVSLGSVERDWRISKAFLHSRLKRL